MHKIETTNLPFWMVWNPGTGYTRARHPTYESAKCEAERLARETSGAEFFVLAAVGRCRRNDVIWDEADCQIVPF